MLNGHGDDIYKYGGKIKSNFSSNIYPYVDLSGLEEYLCSHINVIRSYPDPDNNLLSSLFSEKKGIEKENVTFFNGATDAIYHLAQLFSNKRSAIIYPTFSEYADACQIYNHFINFNDCLQQVAENVDVVWLCNPNNPTGKTLDICQIADYASEHPNQYIIIDQSYDFFTLKPTFGINTPVLNKNIILLHSLTKQYSIPGLRLGYVIADESIIEKIRNLQMPWSVNALALLAGQYLLENKTNDTFCIQDYLSDTAAFRQLLAENSNLTVYDTDTHFFLCKLHSGNAKSLKDFLIQNHGILIRDASNFKGLNEQYFRLSTQRQDDNNKLIEAIASWR